MLSSGLVIDLSNVGGPSLTGVTWFVAFPTGEEVIIWGGYNQITAPTFPGDGGRYDPDSDIWTPIVETVDSP